jgi:hypothetical protein
MYIVYKFCIRNPTLLTIQPYIPMEIDEISLKKLITSLDICWFESDSFLTNDAEISISHTNTPNNQQMNIVFLKNKNNKNEFKFNIDITKINKQNIYQPYSITIENNLIKFT